MKTKLLIVAVALSILQQLNAQEYIPTAVEGAHWIVRLFDKTQPYPVDNLWEYYAEGDTIIDNVTYKNIYKRSLVVTQEGPPFEADGPYELYGFIRDDSTGKKVYAIAIDEISSECPLNEEFLMYNFSVNVGDTAVFCLFPEFYEPTITSITPEIHLGFETRVFATGGGFIFYYEGMGSDFGLFEEMFYPVKAENRKNLFMTDLYYYCRESPCDLLVITPEVNKPIIKVYPNPAYSFITFKLPKQYEKSILEIIDVYGNVLIKTELNNHREVINVQTLKPGVYIYTLRAKGISKTGKILIRK